VAVADLGDAEALARAFAGAEGAYVLVPPNMAVAKFRDYQLATIDAIARAVEKAKVPHVVLLSSVGAQHEAGTGPIAALHVAEKKLSAIQGTKLTALRAGYFMENVGTAFGMLDKGILPAFGSGDAPIEMVATHDIGELAAALLVEGTDKSRVVELGGEKRSYKDVARIVSKIVGKDVAVTDVPLDAVVPTLTGMGMQAELAGLYHEMISGFASGKVAFEGTHRKVVGKTPLETVVAGLLSK
jgi:uncharacterized protein YbjT (DUF2867 family)